jgi:hypothetical protein
MILSITQKDIENGWRLTPEKCPIALAAARAGCRKPYVASNRIEFFVKLKKHTFELPPKARVFVENFDRHIAVSPFRFDLPLELADA